MTCPLAGKMLSQQERLYLRAGPGNRKGRQYGGSPGGRMGVMSTHQALQQDGLLTLICHAKSIPTHCVQEAAGARRGVTARDFFLRFPTLHPLLLQHAEDSAAALGKGSDLHASTFPVLVLLSRLR